ncbi:hypothetical protein IQ274_18320 [Nostoc sp. LEGE 12447]|uniref:hypothetical protein n=1 Tax=Nostoc sp. LEGE 12447 TaxID=1828640 RepID=UPI0018842AD6|nr:hypothetical protein [Nostoc sp. LEGE 12447]MBE9000137.1 hypothetical protein [Nostoc sp. LEGE 12447]
MKILTSEAGVGMRSRGGRGSRGGRAGGAEEAGGAGEAREAELLINAQCPIPYSPLPISHSLFPIPQYLLWSLDNRF